MKPVSNLWKDFQEGALNVLTVFAAAALGLLALRVLLLEFFIVLAVALPSILLTAFWLKPKETKEFLSKVGHWRKQLMSKDFLTSSDSTSIPTTQSEETRQWVASFHEEPEMHPLVVMAQGFVRMFGQKLDSIDLLRRLEFDLEGLINWRLEHPEGTASFITAEEMALLLARTDQDDRFRLDPNDTRTANILKFLAQNSVELGLVLHTNGDFEPFQQAIQDNSRLRNTLNELHLTVEDVYKFLPLIVLLRDALEKQQ